jgi:hypothetical protein
VKRTGRRKQRGFIRSIRDEVAGFGAPLLIKVVHSYFIDSHK